MTTPAVPSRATLVVIWIAAALVLSTLLALAGLARTEGDDADPGRQRPGILDLGALPQPAPPVEGLEGGAGRRTVVFFAGGDAVEKLCRALREDDHLDGERVVLIADPRPAYCAEGVRISTAELDEAAGAFGLRATRGRIPPTGYAIVDAEGRIRYRTLDPVAAELLDEVTTMLSGLS